MIYDPALAAAPADQQQPAGAMSEDERKAFGRAVRTARLEKGWRQADLAERVGTSRSYLCQVEKGHVALSIDLMVRIANALGKRLSVLITN